MTKSKDPASDIKTDTSSDDSTTLTSDHFYHQEEKITTIVDHIWLTEEVVYASDYTKLLHKLIMAPEDRGIFLHLFSHGGDIHGGMALVNAIRRSQACIVVDVMSPCSSMGSILALSGKGLLMNSNTYLMFHDWAGGWYDYGHAVKPGVDRTDKWTKGMDFDICYPFLTKKEIEGLSQGKEITIYASDPDLQERMTRHFGEEMPILGLRHQIQTRKKNGK